jgi:flavin-dependent dehydrogenase
LIFQHAGKSGAHTFDGTKVQSVEFVPLKAGSTTLNAELGKPVSATWSRKDGTTGVVKFDYLIDASGRAGVVSTKYLKNRKHNQGLKNVASWGYWTGAQPYTPKMAQDKTNQPFFESLSDASGWCWKIPLHNGTTSIGVVQNQETATQKKKDMGSPSSKEFYLESLKLAPSILDLLSGGELVTEIKSASDWSYSASSYAAPNMRIVGDAGCFIDPVSDVPKITKCPADIFAVLLLRCASCTF